MYRTARPSILTFAFYTRNLPHAMHIQPDRGIFLLLARAFNSWDELSSPLPRLESRSMNEFDRIWWSVSTLQLTPVCLYPQNFCCSALT